MTDMPEKISAYIKVDNSKAAWHGRLWSYRLSGYGVEYIRADIHEKAVKERDALKAENERLRGALLLFKEAADDADKMYHNVSMSNVRDLYISNAVSYDDCDNARKALQGGE